MPDNKSNIDLLFRNRLKDFETLPPSNAWDNITPAIKSMNLRKKWLGIAASVAALSLITSAAWLAGILFAPYAGRQVLSANQNDNSIELPAISTGGAPVRQTPTNINNTTITSDRVAASSAYFEQNHARLITEAGMPAVQSDETDESRPNTDQSYQSYRESNLIMAESVIPNSWTLPDDLSSTRSNKIDRWAIGAGFAPSMIIKQNFSGSQELENMISNEKMMVSYTGGLSVSYSFNRRITINTGLAYSSMDQRVTGLSTYTGFAPVIGTKGLSDISVSTSAGRVVASNPDIYVFDNMGSRVLTAYGADVFDPVKSNLPIAGTDLMQNFGYLEMPLTVRYKLVDRKLDINISGGIAYSFLVTNSVYTSSFTGEKIYVGITEGMSPFNISSSMGMGIEYSIPGNISFNLEPMVRYYISPIGKQIGSSIHPWAAGIYTGFRYRF